MNDQDARQTRCEQIAAHLDELQRLTNGARIFDCAALAAAYRDTEVDA